MPLNLRKGGDRRQADRHRQRDARASSKMKKGHLLFFILGQVKRNLKELYQLILKVQEERSKSEHNLNQIAKTHEKMQVPIAFHVIARRIE